jgi:tetratricopeptide (TPR) repeat protein
MVHQPGSIMLAAGFAAVLAFSQTNPPAGSKAILESTRAASPQVVDSPKPPMLTAEQRGDILMARKMYREAIEVFSEGGAKDAVLRNKTGIAYHQLAKLDQAAKCYEQAVKLKPDYHEAINNLGTVYYARKNYRRAISQYKRALKVSPDQASVHSNLGTAYFARNQLDLALVEFRTALTLDPEVFEHHSSYGVMLQERSVQDRAKYHYWMATLYASQNRNDLAIQYLRKALEEGFKERKKLTEEPAFALIRELPEFKELLTLEPRVL